MDFFTTQTDGKIQTALHLFKPQDFSFLPEQQRCRNAELQREVTDLSATQIESYTPLQVILTQFCLTTQRRCYIIQLKSLISPNFSSTAKSQSC